MFEMRLRCSGRCDAPLGGEQAARSGRRYIAILTVLRLEMQDGESAARPRESEVLDGHILVEPETRYSWCLDFKFDLRGDC